MLTVSAERYPLYATKGRQSQVSVIFDVVDSNFRNCFSDKEKEAYPHPKL
jgi:hypothetical protein